MHNIKDYISGQKTICVVGLGYVGLPLAVAFAKKFKVNGFDINKNRIAALNNGQDSTGEVSSDKLKEININFTDSPKAISESDLIIVTVPTPIDEHKRPDLSPVVSATQLLGKHIKENTIIVYESTVYPGLTEEVCVPIIEKESAFKWKEGFFLGYSPERINPGDKKHTVETITKVVAGDTKETGSFLCDIYGSVINTIHQAPNIKTAEAAKVIENTQRDLNIALVNELSLIFGKMGIKTKDVLEAAKTKWNFLPFEPGLVGGHCIGVDPYYLTFKAESIGYRPEVILSGRRINDNMGKHVAEMTVKKMIEADKPIKNSKVLILGLTFKENISDIRNTKVIDIFNELKSFGINVSVHDPYANKEEVLNEYGLELLEKPEQYAPYDAIIFAVKHDEYLKNYSLIKLSQLCRRSAVFFDIKNIYTSRELEQSNFIYCQL